MKGKKFIDISFHIVVFNVLKLVRSYCCHNKETKCVSNGCIFRYLYIQWRIMIFFEKEVTKDFIFSYLNFMWRECLNKERKNIYQKSLGKIKSLYICDGDILKSIMLIKGLKNVVQGNYSHSYYYQFNSYFRVLSLWWKNFSETK